MNETAYFIKDRAQSLAYEGRRFPDKAKAALAWLHRAVDWAEQRGMTPLADEVRAAARRVTDHKSRTH